MMYKFPWFQKCVKAATFTEIGESYDVKEFLENGMQLSLPLRPNTRKELLSGFEWFEPDRLDGFADEARAILSQNPNMPPARIESIVKGVMMQMDSAIDFIENQPSFHRLTPAAAKTKEPNTPDFLDSEVADMKDASAKLLCDSNSGQPSKNLHTEH